MEIGAQKKNKHGKFVILRFELYLTRMCKLFKIIYFFFIGGLLVQSCGNKKQNTVMNSPSERAKFTLLEAVEKRDVNLVTEILKTNPNLELKDKKGRTALMVAAYQVDNEIANLLISAGSNVNTQDDMLNSPFLFAGADGNVPLLNSCLSHGADFKVFNRYGGTALIPAAEKGHLEVVQILCKTPGFPIDHVNNLGWTALMEAVILSDVNETQHKIIKTLVEAGADVNIPDRDGVSPLRHAKNKSLTKIADLLRKAGATE